ncbi:DUF5996 family protein [Lipingzhangella sp. LS1_29]|uniref:DUF5996 family protein n=1 Tax=Lipingzhangella rawalii TaxID=2055835 RepID=A0ABU2H698_9ACTN|nr:DUF5996 family protein [Lipingzhangella rawalii]MDS1270816.1 DUF5996 family protein [Lipingzhangella rawalii]
MELFPPIPLQEWSPTKQTLHRWLQIVGKIRLAASPRRNHWWNVPFHLTGTGLTTRPMGLNDGNPVFTIDVDLLHHQLVVSTLASGQVTVPLPGHSVASFHRELTAALDHLGVGVPVPHPYPFDLPDADRPFAADTEHAAYDAGWAQRYWQVLSQVNLLLEEFAAGYWGKSSPVHHFWHTFDIAMTRFSDAVVTQPREAGSVIREAYSRQVISFGFWFGDEGGTVAEPAFYAYTAPEPLGLTEQPLPTGAEWIASGHGHLALLRYERARKEPDPRSHVLDFYEAAYRAGADLLGWDRDTLACPHGATDPYWTELRGRT